MKKVKIISVIVIMLSVVALGVFMGKQMFKLMEADSLPQGSATTSSASNPTQTGVKILYSASDATDISSLNKDIKPAISPIPVATTSVNSSTEPVDSLKIATKNDSEPARQKFDPAGPKWYAYAKGNGINVRKEFTTSSKRLFKVAKGTRGTVLEQKNGWTKIKWDFNRKIGWVRDDLLVVGPANVLLSLVKKTADIEDLSNKKVQSASVKQLLKENKVAVAIAKPAPVVNTVKGYKKGDKLPEQGKIIADPVANIRSQPNVKSAKVGQLPKGVIVQIKSVEQKEKWQWFEIIFNNGKKTGWTREDNLRF